MVYKYCHFVVIPAPNNVRAIVLSPFSIEVTWDRSTSPDVTGYHVKFVSVTASPFGLSGIAGGRNTTSYTITRLEEFIPFTITVTALFLNFNMSGNSKAVTVTTYSASK